MNRQNVEVVDEFNYSEVTLESTGSLNRWETSANGKDYQTLVAEDKCVSMTPTVKVDASERVYETLCESEIR